MSLTTYWAAVKKAAEELSEVKKIKLSLFGKCEQLKCWWNFCSQPARIRRQREILSQ